MDGRSTRPTAALAADRAFVVQFRAGSPEEPLAYLAGRVEHVHSGAVRHFQSLDELLGFFERALVACPPGRSAAGGSD